MLQLLWKTVWRFLNKTKIELQYDPAILFLGIYLKETKTLIQKDICTAKFITALFTIAKIKKRWDIYTMEYYSAIKGNEIELFVVRWKKENPPTLLEGWENSLEVP